MCCLHWPCTIGSPWVDLGRPYPGSFKQEILANRGQKGRSRSTGVIQSCTAIEALASPRCWLLKKSTWIFFTPKQVDFFRFSCMSSRFLVLLLCTDIGTFLVHNFNKYFHTLTEEKHKISPNLPITFCQKNMVDMGWRHFPSFSRPSRGSRLN